MWTLGVGGNPLEVAFGGEGGEVARLEEEVRSLRLGGGWGEFEPFCLNKFLIKTIQIENIGFGQVDKNNVYYEKNKEMF